MHDQNGDQQCHRQPIVWLKQHYPGFGFLDCGWALAILAAAAQAFGY